MTDDLPKVVLKRNKEVHADGKHIGWWGWGHYRTRIGDFEFRITFKAKRIPGKGCYCEGVGPERGIRLKRNLRNAIAYSFRKAKRDEPWRKIWKEETT